jgi:hypothetical protein
LEEISVMSWIDSVRKRVAALVSIGSIVLSCGCGSGVSNDLFQTQARLANGLVGVPSPSTVNIASRDMLQANNLPVGGVSPYILLPSGSITVAATDPAAHNIPLTGASAALSDKMAYTVIVSGVYNTTGITAPKLLTLTDTFPAFGTTPTQAAIRLVNLSPDSPPVDIYSSNPSQPTNINNGVGPVAGLTNISYQNASPYVLVQPNTQNFSLYNTATGVQIPTLTLPRGVTLTVGKVYTLFVIGMTHPTGTQESLDVRITADN